LTDRVARRAEQIRKETARQPRGHPHARAFERTLTKPFLPPRPSLIQDSGTRGSRAAR
jgi:hypothetical protein